MPDLLRYRFPKSTSKNFKDALEFAQGLPGFRQEDKEYWVEFPEGVYPNSEFSHLESLSKAWKGSGHFLGEKRVTPETWWEAANPLGKVIPASIQAGWESEEGWFGWGPPENLVVGESYRQTGLRKLAGVGEDVIALIPVTVTLSRDPKNPHDSNAVKASVYGIHAGFLSRELAELVSPAMLKNGIQEMMVAGALSGSESLGVHLWPDKTLTEGVMVGDLFRPIRAKFHSDPRQVREDYLAAKEAMPRYSPPAPTPKSPFRTAPAVEPASSFKDTLFGLGLMAAFAVIFVAFLFIIYS